MMQTIRRDMLSGNFSETTSYACSQCIKNVNNGMVSRRELENERYLNVDKTNQNVKKFLANEKFKYSDLQYVNFKVLGNICNLQCVMCGPSASSKIVAESIKYFGSNMEKAELNPFNEYTKEQYFNEIDKIVSETKALKMVGGENLIHPNFNELFERFINNKNCKELDLTIITNGTKIPKTLTDNAHKFKSLNLICSIDGVKSRGSYVRYGLNWKTFDENMKNLLNHDFINVKFIVATQLLNIGYIDEIYDYLVNDLGLNPDDVSWDNVVTNPQIHRAINLPETIKKFYIEKFEGHPMIERKPESWNRIIHILTSPQDSHEQFISGIKKLKALDKVRNTNLTSLYPEFLDFYKEL